MTYWPVEKLRALFDERCVVDGVSAESLKELLGADGDPLTFWATVKTNLKAGRIRLLLVGDEIPPEVRRIVEFLNGQMNLAEILAMEIKQFGNDHLKTLVPRVYGQSEQASWMFERGVPRTPRVERGAALAEHEPAVQRR